MPPKARISAVVALPALAGCHCFNFAASSQRACTRRDRHRPGIRRERRSVATQGLPRVDLSHLRHRHELFAQSPGDAGPLDVRQRVRESRRLSELRSYGNVARQDRHGPRSSWSEDQRINQPARPFQDTGIMGFEVHVKDAARFPGKWAFFDFDSPDKNGTLIPQGAPC